jgi:hypothetical protein
MQPRNRPNLILISVSLLSLLVVAGTVWIVSGRGGSSSGGADSSSRPGERRGLGGRSRSGLAASGAGNGATRQELAAESVIRQLREEPNSLSTTAALPPFDQGAFDRDPQEYLARVEPARCFQTAKPGPEAMPLQAQSQNRAAIPQGVPQPLWVKTTPNAPVTFTAFDGGEFKENGLPSVTVQADARGLASAHFFAPRGVEGDVNIVAGSPLASGVQRFLLRIVDQAQQPASLN